MAVIVLQPCAKLDLAEIWEFIADDSDTQADAFIDMIDLILPRFMVSIVV